MLRVLPLFVVLALGACSSPPESAERAPAATRAADAPPSADAPPADAPPAGEPDAAADAAPPIKPVPPQLPAIVARVDGSEISRVEFERAIQALAARIGSEVPAEERDRVYREVLDTLIVQRLLIEEALRRVGVTDAEVDAAVREIRGQFPSDAAFQQMLAAEGLTPQGLHNNVRGEMLVSRLLDEAIGDRVRPSRDEVDAYYRDNREQFRQARVRASQILLAVPRFADAGTRASIRQQAEALAARARDGADFAALAREHSHDPGSAARGGDLGYFEWGEMVEPLNEAAFRLQPKVELDILESPLGFHLLMVTDRQPTDRVVPLTEVRPVIEEMLESANREREADAFVASLREKSRIQIYF